jgi:hypothetical protein
LWIAMSMPRVQPTRLAMRNSSRLSLKRRKPGDIDGFKAASAAFFVFVRPREPLS